MAYQYFTEAEIEEMRMADAEMDKKPGRKKMDKKPGQKKMEKPEQTEEEKAAKRAKIAAYNRKRRAADPEKFRALQREYREKNRERLNAYQRKYYAENHEKVRAQKQKHMRKYIETHREELRERQNNRPENLAKAITALEKRVQLREERIRKIQAEIVELNRQRDQKAENLEKVRMKA